MCVRKNVYQLQIKWGIGKNGVYLAAFTQCRPYYTLKYIHHWIFRFAIFSVRDCGVLLFFFLFCSVSKTFSTHNTHTNYARNRGIFFVLLQACRPVCMWRSVCVSTNSRLPYQYKWYYGWSFWALYLSLSPCSPFDALFSLRFSMRCRIAIFRYLQDTDFPVTHAHECGGCVVVCWMLRLWRDH